jgi:hypothetical protein
MPIHRPHNGLSADYSTTLLPPNKQCSRPDRNKGSSVDCPTIRFLQTDNAQPQATRRATPWSALSFVSLQTNIAQTPSQLRAIALHQFHISISIFIRLLHTEGYSMNRSTIQSLSFLQTNIPKPRPTKKYPPSILPPVFFC